MTVTNLARELLEARGETVEDWDGQCGELGDLVLHAVDDPEASVLYVERVHPTKYDLEHASGERWWWHMVPVVSGLVHDAWLDGPALPVSDYLAKAFGRQAVKVAKNGDDVYSGLAHQYNDRAW